MAQKILKFFASLKFAVLLILAIAGLTAWGTIVESQYNAAIAQKVVYHSIYMYVVMALLVVSLTAVMIDRWPWKKRHTGFVLAHIGIIVLLLGSVITKYFGVDGSMSFEIGQKSRHVTVSETDLIVYTSLDGSSYTPLFEREVDFFSHPPADHPMKIPLPMGEVEILDYRPFALMDEKIVASEKTDDGPAVRFQLQNPNVNVTDWLLQPGAGREVMKDLGPAQIVLTSQNYKPAKGNVIVLKHRGHETLEYAIYSEKKPGHVKKGQVRTGETIETGWMGLVLRVLKVLPNAKNEISFKQMERPSEVTTSAVKIRYGGEEHWVGLNSVLKLFSNEAVFLLVYANRRIDIGFPLQLDEFKIGYNQGTLKAASYQSLVTVPGQGQVLISMNEPLKHAGFTFYQASFQQDEMGRPTASILSVNKDPGRAAKYLGSLLIVLGTIHMFYFKHQTRRRERTA